MRDPFSWAFPVGRLFGITIRVHVLFPLVVVGLIARGVSKLNGVPTAFPWTDCSMIMGLLFLSVLLHELGHCFGAWLVGGEAREVLLWPLGGLAKFDTLPHTPWAHFVAVFWGPFTNFLLCLVTALAMAFLLDPGMQPPWNPLYAPLRGIYDFTAWNGDTVKSPSLFAVALSQFFYVNWFSFLFNVLLIGYPLDGGQMLRAILWPRVGFRQASLYSVYFGIGVVFVICLVAIITDQVLPFFVALYIYASCKQEWEHLEASHEDSLFGYDFSQGYTSLEKEGGTAPPKQRQPNFFQRWLQQRAMRKLQREVEQREAEDRRMDELLEKIQRDGKDSLSDEETRFLKRVSDRYRNRP